MTKHMPKATLFIGRYSQITGVMGADLPRAGERAGGKIEIVHGHEVDPETSTESVSGRQASAPNGRRPSVSAVVWYPASGAKVGFSPWVMACMCAFTVGGSSPVEE